MKITLESTRQIHKTWQGFQFAKITFLEANSDKEWDFDVEEIRELLMENENNK